MKKEKQILLEKANEAYRKGKPIMTDAEYDSLQKEIGQDDSVLGYNLSGRKEKLPVDSFSLNKAKSIEEFQEWLKVKRISPKTLVTLSPKFDGITLIVEELSGKAWTSGDGFIGQRSDKHFKHTGKTSKGFNFTTRGEAIMSKENFKKYSGEFKNARNLVAGLFNAKTLKEDILKDVDLMRFSIENLNIDKSEQFNTLKKLNKSNVFFKLMSVSEVTEELLNDLYMQWSKKYDIDGIVIDIDDYKLRENLGKEQNNNPAYAIAYKNPAWSESAVVKVLGIEWNVSKQGFLKPIINIEPTTVAGVTISNITGYNAAYVFENNIAKNSKIEIVRSGDVIPKHIKTISYIPVMVEVLFNEMAICPSCGSFVNWNENLVELVCGNPNCKQKQIAKIFHFFNTLGVEDFGEPSITKLYDSGFNSIEKILWLERRDFVKIDGFGEKSAINLTSQFNQAIGRKISQAKLMHALDIFDGVIGSKTAQLIFDTDLTEYTIEELVKIKGVAEVSALSFIKGILRLHNPEDIYYTIQSMFLNVYKQSPKIEKTSGKYKGYKVCFTGCRDKGLEGQIVSGGGEITSGVTKTTTHLIVKNMEEKTLSSSKARKAKDLGITIIELSKF